MTKYVCKYHQALDIIAKDFGLLEGQNNYHSVIQSSTSFVKTNEPADIRVEIKDFSEDELNGGVSKEFL